MPAAFHSGGKLVAEAEIFFAHLDQNRSRQLFGDSNFVFGGELRPPCSAGWPASPRRNPPARDLPRTERLLAGRIGTEAPL